MPSSG
jgi:hypothetical protein